MPTWLVCVCVQFAYTSVCFVNVLSLIFTWKCRILLVLFCINSICIWLKRCVLQLLMFSGVTISILFFFFIILYIIISYHSVVDRSVTIFNFKLIVICLLIEIFFLGWLFFCRFFFLYKKYKHTHNEFFSIYRSCYEDIDYRVFRRDNWLCRRKLISSDCRTRMQVCRLSRSSYFKVFSSKINTSSILH